jgi:hypothetical protein
VIASALRRIRPACSQVFGRRLVRILFQPQWRRSLAALTATRPSGWERSQVSASKVIEGAFTPIPAGSPALHAVSGTTGSGLRADVREVSVERASAFSGCSQGPLSRPPSPARCARLSPMWRRHRAAAMSPRFRHTHRVVRPHDPSRQASLRKHRHGRCFHWQLACG